MIQALEVEQQEDLLTIENLCLLKRILDRWEPWMGRTQPIFEELVRISPSARELVDDPAKVEMSIKHLSSNIGSCEHEMEVYQKALESIGCLSGIFDGLALMQKGLGSESVLNLKLVETCEEAVGRCLMTNSEWIERLSEQILFLKSHFGKKGVNSES